MNFIFPLSHGLNKTGLPLIVVKIFNQDICFMLDTGSNNNIIDQKIYDCFKDKLEASETLSEVLTLNGVTKGIIVNIPFEFEHHDYNEPFICSNTTEPFEMIDKESGIRIYGILGNHFFMKYNWIIDFEELTVSSNNNQ